MRTFMLAAAIALSCAEAAAQTPAPAPRPRADVHFVMGWQNLRKEQPDLHYNDWLNDIFYGGAGAGWYWTEHLKTQVDIGAGTTADQYRTRQIPVNGGVAYGSSELEVRQWAVTIAQQYQFFENQWFHPHVGAGVELARETTKETFQPVIFYGSSPPFPREVAPAKTEGPTHAFVARGVGEVGFKAYMTRNAFFTGDMRLMFRNGVDQVLFRAGFGIDF